MKSTITKIAVQGGNLECNNPEIKNTNEPVQLFALTSCGRFYIWRQPNEHQASVHLTRCLFIRPDSCLIRNVTVKDFAVHKQGILYHN